MSWRDISNDREKYAAYLCSREWCEKREAVRVRCSGICERCTRLPMDSCHHLSYLRKYNENLDDLQGICEPCHKFIHGKSSYDPLVPSSPMTERESGLQKIVESFLMMWRRGEEPTFAHILNDLDDPKAKHLFIELDESISRACGTWPTKRSLEPDADIAYLLKVVADRRAAIEKENA